MEGVGMEMGELSKILDNGCEIATMFRGHDLPPLF
jgi:hypothetical protein